MSWLKKKQSLLGTFFFIFFSVAAAFFSHAMAAQKQEDWIKVQLVESNKVGKDSVSAKMINLSPLAIQKGLRDTQLLSSVTFDEKKRVLTYKWHSLSKEIKGTEFAQALSEPLTSEVKVPNTVSEINAGQELIAKGDVESLLSDFETLLAKSKEETEVDASSSLTQDTTNEISNPASSGGSGSNSSGGFLGDGGDLTEQPETGDLDFELDKIIEKVESCSMKVDLTNMIVSQQERIIKTSSKTGEVVEVTECKNVGQAAPVRKDFEAGCTMKLDKTSGQYIKGFKLYAMVDGSRYDISECEWDNGDAITYDVLRDTEKCPLSKSIIKVDRGIYLPAFIKYTFIDGKRFDLSECETSEEFTKELPTKLEQCSNTHDLLANISYAQHRTDTYDPAFKEVLKKGTCSNTGEQYPILRDYKVAQCSNLPNYADSKLYMGYKNFYMIDDKKTFIDGCLNDMANPVSIFQETGSCLPSENLTNREVTIRKRWAWFDEQNKKQYLSECVDSDEKYSIVSTKNTCNPEFLADINKVILKERDGWQNGNGDWAYVSECRPNGEEKEIEKEFCDAPKYEHDYLGGQSYLRSRDYYEYEGKRNYINECSRDNEKSFAHRQDTADCPVENDDNALVTHLFSKTVVDLEEGPTEIKGCEKSTHSVPYQRASSGLIGRQTQQFTTKSSSSGSYPISCPLAASFPDWTIKQACDSMDITKTWGKDYTAYQPSAATIVKKTKSCNTAYKPCTGNNCSGFPSYSASQTNIAHGVIEADIRDWIRMDGTKYRQVNHYVCRTED